MNDHDSIKPGDIEWRSTLLLGDSDQILYTTMARVWGLEARGRPKDAIAVLREALDALGPGSEVGAARGALGSELLLRQRSAGDLTGAMWTAGRLLLSASGTDRFWQPTMDLMGNFAAAGREEHASVWWTALEVVYESHESPPWDVLDDLAEGWDQRELPPAADRSG